MEEDTPSMQQQNQVMLDSSAFQQALATYIDDNKPDPIVCRQLEGWTVEWKNLDGGGESKSSDDENNDNEAAETAFQLSQQNTIRGTVTIQGEYVAVTLLMECSWNHPDGNSENTKSSDGILTFSCRVDSAKLLDKSSNSTADGESDNDKADRKIRKKMTQRLRQDSYIAKLLALNNKQQAQQSSSSFDPYLAKARIHVHQAKNILEERVDVSDTVAEALRRAVWSSADSSLDVIEVVLALPSLPGTSHKDCIPQTTSLANRAKLRLLEDAMLDECEKEGEGELIQELSIGQRDGQDANKGGNSKKESSMEPHPKKKKSRSKR